MKTSLLCCALAIVATAAALVAASPTLPARGSVSAAARAQRQLLATPAGRVHAHRLLKHAPSAAEVATRLQKNTPNFVRSLAMDGPRIAYDVASSYPGKRCNGVYVWNVANRATARVSGAGSCGNEGSSTGAGVREVAVAGPRVAWIVNEGGNTYHKDYLYTAALPRPKEHLLASAYREGEGEGTLTCGRPHPTTSVGKWIGCLVGAQTVLMVNRWSTGNSGRLASARLDSIGKRLREITSGTGSMDALSTDGGRVAVVRSDGTVALYSARDGSLLRVVSTSAAEAAVRGNDLVVLTSTGELEVRNSHSGGLLHTWPLAGGARFLDVCRGLASYAAPLQGGYGAHAVHAIRLSSGEDRIVARHPHIWTAVGDVQLEPPGLAYDVSVGRASDRGAVVFLPMSSLR